ncbi:hypothetical protein D3C86_1683700 [compost metagenome]
MESAQIVHRHDADASRHASRGIGGILAHLSSVCGIKILNFPRFRAEYDFCRQVQVVIGDGCDALVLVGSQVPEAVIGIVIIRIRDSVTVVVKALRAVGGIKYPAQLVRLLRIVGIGEHVDALRGDMRVAAPVSVQRSDVPVLVIQDVLVIRICSLPVLLVEGPVQAV